jgi:zona occludens toxin
MITLITGSPGSGKTAWLLDQLLDLKKQEPNRLLFIHGVRNLRGIQHETIYCESQLCDICRSAKIPAKAKFVENWPEWQESGSLIVVDEVQRIWRPRSGGSQPSAAVSGLETHRHYGLDFWLISQGPHLFDNFIRLLVGKHVHLISKWNGRTQYEWPECKQDVQARSDAVVRTYSLPKRVYQMYDSAEVHTKTVKRKPMSLYFIIVALTLAIGLCGFLYHRINTRINPVQQEQAVGADGALATSDPTSSAQLPNIIKSNLFPDFKPAIDGLSESAPAYSALIKVTTAPLLIGCVKTPDWCRCYTNQATPYQVSALFCSEYIAGHVYNPYRDKQAVPNASTQYASNEPLANPTVKE